MNTLCDLSLLENKNNETANTNQINTNSKLFNILNCLATYKNIFLSKTLKLGSH